MPETQPYLVIREVLRNYSEFEAYVSQTGKFELVHGEYVINFLALQGCLQKLSPRKQEAVYWSVIRDKKQKEVAAKMGITTVSVGQYVKDGCIQVAKWYFAEHPLLQTELEAA